MSDMETLLGVVDIAVSVFVLVTVWKALKTDRNNPANYMKLVYGFAVLGVLDLVGMVFHEDTTMDIFSAVVMFGIAGVNFYNYRRMA